MGRGWVFGRPVLRTWYLASDNLVVTLSTLLSRDISAMFIGDTASSALIKRPYVVPRTARSTSSRKSF